MSASGATVSDRYASGQHGRRMGPVESVSRVIEQFRCVELVRSDGEWLRDGKKIPFTAASDFLAALTRFATAKAREPADPER